MNRCLVILLVGVTGCLGLPELPEPTSDIGVGVDVSVVTPDAEGDAAASDVGPPPGWYGLTVGRAHVCALARWGEAYCWGDNTSG